MKDATVGRRYACVSVLLHIHIVRNTTPPHAMKVILKGITRYITRSIYYSNTNETRLLNDYCVYAFSIPIDIK